MRESLTLLDLSRLQFAVTIVFHMTFPAVTVGLSVFLTVTYAAYLRTGDAVYLQIFRFWKRIFAVGFALGVVAGTVITFELGLNWGPFAAATGPVLGPIIGMEVVTAFFLEAGFIGVMLYGDGRVKERTMLVCCALVSLGTLLSTTWIIAANSWMQTPSGFRVVAGQFQPTSWWAAIVNPSFRWRYPHMLLAVLIAAAWFVAGVGAYYLVRRRSTVFARRTFSAALGVLALLLPVQLWVGDNVAGRYVVVSQPAKAEALEGNWTSGSTGYNLLVLPDEAHQRNSVQIAVPWLGSAIAKDLTGRTGIPGLRETPVADQPGMWGPFYGFRVMFYSSMLMFAAAMAAVVLRLRRRLYSARWLHRFVLWLTPVGVIAIIGGWVTAETGRQPWVVHGLLRTDAGVSALAPWSVIASFIGFLVVYIVLFGVWVGYVVRSVRRGPDDDLPVTQAPPGSAPTGLT